MRAAADMRPYPNCEPPLLSIVIPGKAVMQWPTIPEVRVSITDSYNRQVAVRLVSKSSDIDVKQTEWKPPR